jgi:hypothetical protein
MGVNATTPMAAPALRNVLEPLAAEELQQWLEWAGGMLLALGIASPAPKGPSSAWPAYAQDAQIAYGYAGERLRAPRPGRHDIVLMDEILVLPSMAKDITTRRLLHSRALVTPIGQRHLYPWAKLAFMLHTSRFRVQRMHNQGLNEIVRTLPPGKTYAIRHSMALCTT